ncbi:MAG: ergothioneine biosynthesis protein EgtB [Parvularculales bacterium]
MTSDILIHPASHDAAHRTQTRDPTPCHHPPAHRDDREGFLHWYNTVRTDSQILADPLAPEDMVIQSMPDVSPTKWHLAHTSWFFETFLLTPYVSAYEPPNAIYGHLFNSYYEGIGQPFSRLRRGMISRPTVSEILDYRAQVDAAMAAFILNAPQDTWREAAAFVSLGLHHEQQHQELMLTDIKHVLSENPMMPAAYKAVDDFRGNMAEAQALEWHAFDGGLVDIGHDSQGTDPALDFAFDNESPRHEQLVRPFLLANRLITNGEYLSFVEDGGYQNPLLWLADGWSQVQENNWVAPLYWQRGEGYDCEQSDVWREFTLAGLVPLNPATPVCHLSYYEADAFARWADARLPSEEEQEHAANGQSITGNFGRMIIKGIAHAVHPDPATKNGTTPNQIYGDVWEWSHSAYAAYPGYRPAQGAVGEYNGKFMCGQYALRGGSCATPTGHVRLTYRNFFPPSARWQFSGLRLAQDA